MVNVSNKFLVSFLDYPDNENCAIVVYFYGCEHSCIDCHNQSFKELSECFYKTTNNLVEDIKVYALRNKTNKIVLSGGDPLHPKNIKVTQSICDALNLNYDICIYTGYDKNYVVNNKVTNFKYVKCGTYDHTKKQLSEKTDDYLSFASTNQFLINSDYEIISNNGNYKFKI